jgi:hypothetical protein
VHPDILQKMIGHFYRQKGDTWVPKRKAAFMQTPQVLTLGCRECCV